MTSGKGTEADLLLTYSVWKNLKALLDQCLITFLC